MNTGITVYRRWICFLLFYLVHSFVSAQSIKKPLRYSHGDDITLSEMGFNAYDYKWDHDSINFHLNKALRHKRRGNQYMAVGISVAAVGAFVAMFTSIYPVGEANETRALINGGSIMASGGLIILLGKRSQQKKAREHVFRATQLRKSMLKQ